MVQLLSSRLISFVFLCVGRLFASFLLSSSEEATLFLQVSLLHFVFIEHALPDLLLFQRGSSLLLSWLITLKLFDES